MSEPAKGSKWGLYNRVNRVPHYQRLYQKHDGLRQWQKTPSSKYILPAYHVLVWGTFSGCMYMMVRMTLGHRTWFGKD